MSILAKVLVAGFFALIPAIIANSRGRSGIAWWFYGLLLGPVAFVHSIVLHPNDDAMRRRGYVRCLRCSEFVRHEALVCPHCSTEREVRQKEPLREPDSSPGQCEVWTCPNCGSRISVNFNVCAGCHKRRPDAVDLTP